MCAASFQTASTSPFSTRKVLNVLSLPQMIVDCRSLSSMVCKAGSGSYSMETASTALRARHGSSNDVTDGHKLFAGDILYETTGVSNLYLWFGKTITCGIHALLALPGIRHRGICNRRAGKLP